MDDEYIDKHSLYKRYNYIIRHFYRKERQKMSKIVTGVILIQATQKDTQTTSNVKCSRFSVVAPQARAWSRRPVITHSRPPIC